MVPCARTVETNRQDVLSRAPASWGSGSSSATVADSTKPGQLIGRNPGWAIFRTPGGASVLGQKP